MANACRQTAAHPCLEECTEPAGETVTALRVLILGHGLPEGSAGLILHAAGEKTLYHMGDTDIFGDMALINELHRPDVGIVPIGDRFTMGGAVAALACRRYFGFETILPCHYASFPIIDRTADKFIAAMEGDAGKVKVLEVGGSIEV